MDIEGVLEAGRAIRPYLPTLVGPTSDELDGRLAQLLNSGSAGGKVAAAVDSLLSGDQTTSDFLAEVLADAPQYRPPELQTGYLAGRGARDTGFTPLAGTVGPVKASKFICLSGDYVWYRPSVAARAPKCPTHGDLVQA